MEHPVNNGKRLRVLQVGKFYLPHVGGMETHLRTLCGELKRDMDVEVIVANDGPRTERAVIDGVSVTRVGTRANFRSTPICPDMVRGIRSARAGLVHVHLPNPWAVLAVLLSGYRGPMVVTWHSDVVRQRVFGPALEPLMRGFLRRCHTIIATSDNYIDSSPVLSRMRERCQAVPFGISVQDLWCRDAGAVRQIRRRFGRRIVLSAGRLVYYKGIEYLIRAMESVDAQLLIVGDGPLRHRLEAGAGALIGNRIHFLGHVENVAPYYHACDVFVLPSVARSEGFGIVQLEAMACGKPVVNTWLKSGVPFVSLDGITGLTVAPRDSEEMAGALNRLLDNAVLRKQYGDAARHRVRTEFTLRRMVERIVGIYQQATNVQLEDGGAEREVRSIPAAT